MEYPIQSLWIGSRISKIEELSMASFVDQGHDYHLYTYGPLSVPGGVKIKDANEIVNEEEIFRNVLGARSYTAFSNLFRYKLLHDRGGWWCDVDVVCLKPFDFSDEYVFGRQKNGNVNNAVMFSESEKDFMRQIYLTAKNTEFPQQRWGLTGPKLLTRMVDEYSLRGFVKGQNVFYPIDFEETDLLFKSTSLSKESYGLHLWNEILLRQNINKDAIYSKDTLFGRLQYENGVK